MAERKELPYGVGRLSPAFWVWIGILLAVLGWGIFAYSRQFIEGLVVTGLRDIGTMLGASWGLYVLFDIYFVGVSFGGITTAALIRILGIENLRPISRIAEVLAVISLILAAFSILPDLGQPLRALINLPRYARPMSPFFGTFTMVISAYLFASLVYLYLSGRKDAAICARIPSRLQWFHRLWAAGYKDTPEERERHHRVSFWLALAIIPLLVTAHSTLGFVFGLQAGRPGWFSALQAPAFVIMAGVSGIGLLIVVAAVLRWVLKLKLSLEIFSWLGNLLWVLIAVYIYFSIAEFLTFIYASPHHEGAIARELLVGDLAWLFWLSMGLLVVSFIILFFQFALRRYSLPLIVMAGVMVNLAAIGKRFLIVVPSQIKGTLLPYGEGWYHPTWVEYSIILGVFALGAILYTIFVKVFPITEVPEER